jgi:periplasmic protein CpxP/Spy
MTMKKLLFIAAIFSIISFSADAQQKRKRSQEKVSTEKRAEIRAERMADQLDLTEEQKSQVYQIHLQRAQAQQEMRESRREEMRERRSAMEEVRNEHLSEIEEILTPDQKLKWKELRNEERERMELYRDARGSGQSERLREHRKSENTEKIRRNRSNNK